MAPILAQNMPGMEWIPLLLLAPGSGLLLGVLSLSFLPFRGLRAAGRRTGIVALVIGVVPTLLLAVVAGKELTDLAYAMMASPALLGAVAWGLHRRPLPPEPRGFPVVPSAGRED